jgi:hypothetical protein
MPSFDLVPTIEMIGPAGRVVVNADEQTQAEWRTRGYNPISGSRKGSHITVTESAGGPILDATGQDANPVVIPPDDKTPDESDETGEGEGSTVAGSGGDDVVEETPVADVPKAVKSGKGNGKKK